MTEASVRVGVIGLGFMGRTHIEAYRAAAADGLANELVAVCARDPLGAGREGEARKRAGNLGLEGEQAPLFDPAVVRSYDDAERMLREESLDLVSICTPTDTHVDLACAALRAGAHVLVEKPVALNSAEVQRLADVARETGKLCMPGLCMRFWPGWRWLRNAVANGTYGSVISATFRRLTALPPWSRDFYGDPQRSGGALFDLHVHDADVVRWLFGTPDSVVSTGGVEHLTTLYRFANGPRHVVAEGGWDQAPGLPFHMTYRVVFEHATADFDFQRDPLLLLVRDGEAEAVELPPGTGYEAEIRHLLRTIHAGGGELEVTVDEALHLTRLLEAERASCETGEAVRLGGSGT